MLDVASAKIDRFGWGNMDAGIKDALRRDWVSRLEKYELQEVKAGIDRLFHEAHGQLRSVNEHQVEAAILANRSEEFARLPKGPEPAPDPNRRRVTAEEATEILAAVGFSPKRFG